MTTKTMRHMGRQLQILAYDFMLQENPIFVARCRSVYNAQYMVVDTGKFHYFREANDTSLKTFLELPSFIKGEFKEKRVFLNFLKSNYPEVLTMGVKELSQFTNTSVSEFCKDILHDAKIYTTFIIDKNDEGKELYDNLIERYSLLTQSEVG